MKKIVVSVVLVLVTSPLWAGSSKNATLEEEPRFTLEKAFDALWRIPVLYENKENPYIQKIAVTGRYQGQLWGINSNFGSASGWENRRQRIGGKIAFLKTFEAHVTFNLNFDGSNTGRFVENFEDFGITWEPMDAFNFEIGLFKVPITNEWRESSNTIITIERSDFVNLAVPPKLGGFQASGEIKGFTEESAFTYGAGLYTAARDEDWELPTLDGGAIIYAGVGYRFTDKQAVRFDGAALTSVEETNAAPPYSYTASLSYNGRFLEDRLRVQSDLVMGIGAEDTPDLFGIILLPSYRLTEQIELVARYQYLVSNESDGVRLQSRYERRVPDLPTSFGNNYHALYGGVNYYIYKNKMKVMAGLEYSHMDLVEGGDYNQVTLFGAFRFWF
jgi:hypothetical protein